MRTAWSTVRGKAGRDAPAWSKFRPAIAELGVALKTVETNAPINEREGNTAQARLERDNAKSFRAAIAKLKG